MTCFAFTSINYRHTAFFTLVFCLSLCFNAQAQTPPIVINEIMLNPKAAGDSFGEWIELHNISSVDVDINGWMLADTEDDTTIIDNGGPLIIPKSGYLVLGISDDTLVNGEVPVDYSYHVSEFLMSNEDDELILISSDGEIVDRVDYDGGPMFLSPEGASMALHSPYLDNNDGANWCTSYTPYGEGDLGTPGAPNDCRPIPNANLRITELWVGQVGDDLTEDWFEITNFGPETWDINLHDVLYYDDDSQDALLADTIHGINQILPGGSVVVVIGTSADADSFYNVWSPDYDLSGTQIGWTDGAGLGQSIDGATLFLGGPTTGDIINFESYNSPPSGVSYDVILEDFSVAGQGIIATGTNIAVATTATAGSGGMEPAVGSPGNMSISSSISQVEKTFNLRVYPNPTKGPVLLDLENNNLIESLWVFDLSGYLLLEKHGINNQQVSADLSRLPMGIYNIMVKNTHGFSTAQLVKI